MPLARLLTLLLAATAPAWADEPSGTDQPDFVESAAVVGRGRVQIESSFAWECDRAAGQRSRQRSTPTPLRMDMSDAWELRLETEGALHSRCDGLAPQRGWADLSVGAEWHAQDGDEARREPALAWLFHLDLSTGSAPSRAAGKRPSRRLVPEWELPGGMSLGVMPGLYADRDEHGRRHAGGILAAVVGRSVTERLRAFVTLSGQQLISTRHGGSVVTADIVVAWLLERQLQLDAAASRELTRESPDWRWTVGLSVRY